VPTEPNFERAFRDLMDLEGHGTPHEVEGDSGGLTAWGIARNYNPHMFTDGIPSRDEAMRFYREAYWYPLRLDQLKSHEMAFEIFEMSVNTGDGDGYEPAVRAAQEAANEVLRLSRLDRTLSPLAEDGRMGPMTRRVLNHVARVYEKPWIKLFNHRQLLYYYSLPEDLQRRFLLGWTRRV